MKTILRTLGVIVFLSLSLNSKAQTIQIDNLYKLVINSMIATYKKPIEKKRSYSLYGYQWTQKA